LAIRRRLHTREPQSVDLAEELVYGFYLLSQMEPAERDAARAQAEAVLEPFERSGAITQRAAQILAWARG